MTVTRASGEPKTFQPRPEVSMVAGGAVGSGSSSGVSVAAGGWVGVLSGAEVGAGSEEPPQATATPTTKIRMSSRGRKGDLGRRNRILLMKPAYTGCGGIGCRHSYADAYR